jgi:hypothetical protein
MTAAQRIAQLTAAVAEIQKQLAALKAMRKDR